MIATTGSRSMIHADHHDESRIFLRHTLATVAYRAAKVLRDAPEGFGSFRIGESSRTPCEVLAHIGDLMDWMLSMAKGEDAWRDAPAGTWDEEAARLFAAIGRWKSTWRPTSRSRAIRSGRSRAR